MTDPRWDAIKTAWDHLEAERDEALALVAALMLSHAPRTCQCVWCRAASELAARIDARSNTKKETP